MPKVKVPVSPLYPFHLTARCINREWFGISLNEVWEIMENYLFFIHHAYSVKIHAFVLMPNHFHLIARFPLSNLGESMNYFMRETSRTIGPRAKRINHVYGSRVYRNLILSGHYFMHAYKYLYRNPVKAGLVDRVETYPFSTLMGMLGYSKLIIPIEEDTLLFSPELKISTLEWLNRTPLEKHQDEVRRALRRSIFTLPSDKNSKKPSDLETMIF